MASDVRFPKTCSLDVVGIGNAIVDVLVQTEDAFLTQHSLQKGGMALIDEKQAEALYTASGPGLETSGGSVANTMVGIAQLGGRAGFIGRVKNDQLGGIFSHDIRAVGARFDTQPPPLVPQRPVASSMSPLMQSGRCAPSLGPQRSSNRTISISRW